MEDPEGTWTSLAAFLRSIAARLSEEPRAILIVSGHWETVGFATTANPTPPLIYDYYGFPPQTYQLRYDAPGDPPLARRVANLLRAAGLEATTDMGRGLDHGVFVPLKVMYPDAKVPVVELSLDRTLDPAMHREAGAAIASLREEKVLVIGAGMSFHNLRAYGQPRALAPSKQFDDWLTAAVESAGPERAARLANWELAPQARVAHPRQEHLLPLMLVAGTSEAPGRRVFNEKILNSMISGYRFD